MDKSNVYLMEAEELQSVKDIDPENFIKYAESVGWFLDDSKPQAYTYILNHSNLQRQLVLPKNKDAVDFHDAALIFIQKLALIDKIECSDVLNKIKNIPFNNYNI